jgi:hypothetical protein
MLCTPPPLRFQRQCVQPAGSLNMLHPHFANFTDLKSVPADPGLVTSDSHHLPLSIYLFLCHFNNNLKYEFSYQIFASDNYTLLYNILSTRTYGCSSVYETLLSEVSWSRQFVVVIAATK